MPIVSDIRAVVLRGTEVPCKDGTATINWGGFTRTEIMAGQRLLSSSVQGAPGTIGFTAVILEGMKVRETFDFVDGQIRVIFDNGKEILMDRAFLETPPDWSAGAGDLAVAYKGSAWTEE